MTNIVFNIDQLPFEKGTSFRMKPIPEIPFDREKVITNRTVSVFRDDVRRRHHATELVIPECQKPAGFWHTRNPFSVSTNTRDLHTMPRRGLTYQPRAKPWVFGIICALALKGRYIFSIPVTFMYRPFRAKKRLCRLLEHNNQLYQLLVFKPVYPFE